MRGGHTRLAHITAPQADFGGPHGKTDALHAMELALSFEKLNFQKLKELQGIAEDNKDAQMSDFVEGMMQEQVGKLCFFCSYSRAQNSTKKLQFFPQTSSSTFLVKHAGVRIMGSYFWLRPFRLLRLSARQSAL